jgi:hypothetical protein
MSAFKKVCAGVATAAALLVSGAASAEAPGWTMATSFSAPEGAAPGTPFAARLVLTTTAMTVETDPADKMIQHPFEWWGIFDFLAKQDPAGAVPLMQLDAGLFPGLTLNLVATDKGELIPADRSIVRLPLAERTASFWEVIAGPGKTWSLTEGDHAGWSKAAFPISLVQSQEGEAWLGLASFEYKDGQVTPLQVQFSSDSGGGFLFWDPDFDVRAWAEVPATFDITAKIDAAAVTADFNAERAARLPIKPLDDLGDTMKAAAGGLDPVRTLAVAVLHKGTLYMNPVTTPFGTHPYPQDMRVGVWSASKSLIPGMAALRLAQKYGPEFLDTTIVGYFKEGEDFTYPSSAAKERMDKVTIRNALNMQSGMGPDGYDANWDSKSTNTYEWSYSYALADQISHYFNQEPNPNVAGPGKKMVYMDQDMWISTLAMQRFLQYKEGPDATILNMLEAEVYAPIGAPHFVSGTNYTPDGSVGFPFSAWGALPTIDALARAGQLIAHGGKGPDGGQILDQTLVASLSAGPNYGLAFWRTVAKRGDTILNVPGMRGSGGNIVLSLPNGDAIVVLGRDDYNHSVSDAQLVALIEATLDLSSN